VFSWAGCHKENKEAGEKKYKEREKGDLSY
jgi:hypothetical protein